jgi:hypothetical protein
MTAYKDERNKAYAGWTLNLLSVLLIHDPLGDLTDHDATSALSSIDTETGTMPNSILNIRSHLRF